MSPLALTIRIPLRLTLLLLTALTLLVAGQHSTAGANQKYWELSPYRVLLHLTIDDSNRSQPRLGESLAGTLRRRIRSTLYPLWSTQIVLSSGRRKQHLLQQLPQLETLQSIPVQASGSDPGEATTTESQTTKWLADYDKQLFLNVVATPLGSSLTSREFDCATLRWSGTEQRQVRQNWMLPEHCFDLLCQTFSPLATIRPLPIDTDSSNSHSDKQVLLRFRGSELPRQSDLSFLSVPGQAFLPLMVRTRSAGNVKTDTIREIPWTYLTLSDQQTAGWRADIHTGTRRPFGVRRRGRVEHLALATGSSFRPTRVQFHARHDTTLGLSGYEVFRRDPLATTSQFVGLTDSAGGLELPPEDSNVTLLFLRSEGQLLAKLPILRGAKPLVTVPVADDTARLRAQASLTALTERLIDTVAQRNILMSRVRNRLANDQLDEAQALFSELDSLPGRAQFDQLITSAENRRLHQSADPKVQARIERLFADTRKLLGRFLSTKQVSQLQGELTAARRKEAE